MFSNQDVLVAKVVTFRTTKHWSFHQSAWCDIDKPGDMINLIRTMIKGEHLFKWIEILVDKVIRMTR